MKRFEITYISHEDGEEPLSIGTVANNEIKALKAFALKVPGIPSNQIIAVNGQPVKTEWFSAYPNYNGVNSEIKKSHADKNEDNRGSTVSFNNSHQDTIPTSQDSFPVLGSIGIILMLIGVFFLAINPGSQTGFENVINFHKVIIGQTLFITGGIFIAVQWRPMGR